ncbi:hypothetical protein [Streptomyces sp. enrichment culture]|uniref:hypothetical protein n=1 Tax=Streptomyces sp. enrichment culture TaxID=1795815 RepID=UPI003F5742D5
MRGRQAEPTLELAYRSAPLGVPREGPVGLDPKRHTFAVRLSGGAARRSAGDGTLTAGDHRRLVAADVDRALNSARPRAFCGGQVAPACSGTGVRRTSLR